MALEEKLLLPYFYGQESEQFSFYRIPKALFSNPAFDDLSTDAKLLYGLLLDRMGLSVKNHWMDEQGRVFIYYTVESIMRDLHCGNQKAAKLLAELEKKHGLIERKKQGLGKPDIIYVKNFVGVCMQQSHVQKCENHMSEDVKIMPQEMCISHSNDTYDSQNKFHPIEYIQLSGNRNLIVQMEEAGATVLNKKYIDIEIKNQKIRLGGIYGYVLSPGDKEDTEQTFMEEFQDTDRVKILLSVICQKACCYGRVWNTGMWIWYSVVMFMAGRCESPLWEAYMILRRDFSQPIQRECMSVEMELWFCPQDWEALGVC